MHRTRSCFQCFTASQCESLPDPKVNIHSVPVRLPLQVRCVPKDGVYDNGEVIDYLDADDDGYRMPLQLMPKGIPHAQLTKNDVKWKEFTVRPSTTVEDGNEYDGGDLCSCLGPTNSWCTCPHAALLQVLKKIGTDAICHPWCRSCTLYDEQLQASQVHTVFYDPAQLSTRTSSKLVYCVLRLLLD